MRSMLALIAFLPSAAFAAAVRPDDDYGRFWGHGFWGEDQMMFGGFMMILFFAVIIVLVVLAVRWIGGAAHPPSHHVASNRSALEILEERFARGEIDQEEFRARKQELSR